MAFVKAISKKVLLKRDLRNTARLAEKLQNRWMKDVFEQDSHDKDEFDYIKGSFEKLIKSAETLTVNRNG